MTFCEICEKRATHVCSGLDIPALYFCAKCVHKHAEICAHVKREESTIVEMGAPESSEMTMAGE